MEDKLSELVERLRKPHADKLVSVILYGSAAAGDHHEKFSDLNVLCILSEITPSELAASEPVFAWWRGLGNPAPLLMSEREAGASTDCFPIEFEDMKERRRVLYGRDVIAPLVIDKVFYRAQVEHDLRAKLIRLRQKAAAVLNDKAALLKLMLESVSTFLILARHALLLSGVEVGFRKRDVALALRANGLDSPSFEALLALREEPKNTAEPEAAELFSGYLRQIEAIVEYVDRLEK
jgi:hypothetical protein